MEDKTCVELLHTLSELKNLYSEYKDTTGQAKYFFEKHFEYLALKKDGMPDKPSGMPRLDESKQIKAHTEVSLLQQSIDDKMNTLETGLQKLKTMIPVQDCGTSSVASQKVQKLNRTKDMDMPTLKRERERLLKLQEIHEKRSILLTNELKQSKQKFESMEATFAQEKSKFAESMTARIDELQNLLKEARKENKHLEEKYQKERFKRKHTREDLERANCKNSIMTKKVEELQVKTLDVLTNYKCLEEKYEKEKATFMHTIAEMEQRAAECQVQLDQASTDYQCLEIKYQKDTSDYNKKIEELDRDIKKRQAQLDQAREENKHLEEKHQDELAEREKTGGELQQSIKELQLQLKKAEKEMQIVEGKYNNEKDMYKRAREELERVIYMLQNQLMQAGEESKNVKKEYQDEIEINQKIMKELKQLQDKLKLAEEDNRIAREKHNMEKLKHKSTREELNQDITELQFQLKLAEEDKARLEEKHQSGLNQVTEELETQLRQMENENQCVEEKYQQEVSKHRATSGELDEARRENQALAKNLEELERHKEHETGIRDQQIQQLQTNERKMKEELHTQQHAQAESSRCIENLRDQLHACGVFMRYLLDTRNKLKDNLSDKDRFYGEREKRYVKLVNMHIQNQHQARNKLEKTFRKSSKTWPHKLSCWWNRKVLRDHSKPTSWEEDEMSVYPDDWRLPDIQLDSQVTSKHSKNEE